LTNAAPSTSTLNHPTGIRPAAALRPPNAGPGAIPNQVGVPGKDVGRMSPDVGKPSPDIGKTSPDIGKTSPDIGKPYNPGQ